MRHGQTEYNREKRFFGLTDVPLNEAGRSEVQEAALRLSGTEFDAVYASPLARARETAEMVMRQNAHPKDIFIREELREVWFGDWEGMLADEIETRFAEDWKKYIDDFYGYTFPNGDCIGTYNDRARAFVKSLAQEHPAGNVLIVSHKGFILSALSQMLHGDYKSMFKYDLDTARQAVLGVYGEYCILKALNI